MAVTTVKDLSQFYNKHFSNYLKILTAYTLKESVGINFVMNNKEQFSLVKHVSVLKFTYGLSESYGVGLYDENFFVIKLKTCATLREAQEKFSTYIESFGNSKPEV